MAPGPGISWRPRVAGYAAEQEDGSSRQVRKLFTPYEAVQKNLLFTKQLQTLVESDPRGSLRYASVLQYATLYRW